MNTIVDLTGADPTRPGADDAIAIIGMAGRFPGADDVETFWRNVRAGTDANTRFRDDELEDAFPPATRTAAAFVRARPILAAPDLFDAAFFGMYPREADLTDPQHRVFLECAWEALESAGYDPAGSPLAIGVFAGCSMNTYFLNNVCADRGVIEDFTSNFQLGQYPMLLGAGQDFLSTRVAYKLDLRGPAMTLGTACSSSLMAVAQACEALRTRQADMMLAGGVSISFPQKRGYLYQKGGMASADGTCRPFDAEASGTVFGSGAAVVLLKRLADAVADRDTIHGVIRGVSANNDGSRKVGFTAPSIEGQVDVIRDAHRRAGVPARSIGYVECHGTATPLGDPIEFAALVRAFDSTTDQAFCALGSAKANVGHLDAAAGVTGLIKAMLAVRDGVIPPLAHFTSPNPLLKLDGSPFIIEGALRPWPNDSAVRRAGVTALGVGGTNVHVVLEQAPDPAACGRLKPWEAAGTGMPLLLPLSARTPEALKAMAAALGAHLAADEALDCADVASTLQRGRRAFEHRAGIVCHDRRGAVEALGRPLTAVDRAASSAPPVVFLFPGQGAHYAGMGRALYAAEPIYRAMIDDGARILLPLIGRDIRVLLLTGGSANDAELRSTELAQPALFLVEYATARLWMHWGIVPDAMVGHSIGELVCATLAGVFTFEDALAFVASRGRLMQAMPAGGMLAVRLSEAETAETLPPDLAIAAVNAPRGCVVAGSLEAVEAYTTMLNTRGVASRPIHTSHAFHSPMMDPILDALEAHLESVTLHSPAMSFVSGITADWADPALVTTGGYWARHCRSSIRFADAVTCAVGDDRPVLLEVGPGGTLGRFASQTLPKDAARGTFASLPDTADTGDDRDRMLGTLARLWGAGCVVRWDAVGPSDRRRVPLPTYPFERQRHWIEPPPRSHTAAAPVAPLSPPVGTDPERVLMAAPIAAARFEPPAVARAVPGLRTRLIGMLEELSGETIGDVASETSFLELGFDSLFLAQLATQVQAGFGIEVTFRQLLGDLSSIAALAEHLQDKLPRVPDVLVPTSAALGSTEEQPLAAQEASGPASIQSAPVHDLMQQQIAAFQTLFAQQLQVLGKAAAPEAGTMPILPAPSASRGVASPTVTTPPEIQSAPSRLQVYQADKGPTAISAPQRCFIDALAERYGARTVGSKRLTQEHRRILADPRAAAGFRRDWKEVVYPLVCARSKGATLWDVDGNAYVDLVNGYGQTLFGHAPDFILDAVSNQMEQGFAIGPQSPLAGDVAERIHRLTGNARVTFCNTGSEAVMAAMRVARTVTGRTIVVIFEGAYHGQFDEVLVRGAGRTAAPGAMPAAPGIPRASTASMVVLPYGTPESLAWIRDNAGALAAVIVEPVQSRLPAFLPHGFIAELRTITAQSGSALVFDEVVTGFRVHPGGMQAVLGIRADLVTYGKVVGGGMPIGILAGTTRFMDALDGGFWSYGNDSVPEVAPTFFAGTFVRHPLALAAARAVLARVESEGPTLQEGLAIRTAALVARINADLARRGLTSRAETFSSWFYLNLGGEHRLASLFFLEARCRGLHIQEGFPCFLTTAHDAAAIDRIAEVFAQSLDALQAVGILQGSSPAPPASTPIPADLPDAVLWTESQKEIWLAAQRGDEASCAFNESVSLAFDGVLDVTILRDAWADVVARHDSLRALFDPDRESMIVQPDATVDMVSLDLTATADAAAALAALIAADARLPFDLVAGPLVRATLVATGASHHVLVLTAHHMICDGWSINVLIEAIATAYAARHGGRDDLLPEAPSFRRYALHQAASIGGSDAHWRDVFADLPPALELPADRARPRVKSYRGATHHDHIDGVLVRDVKAAGARHGCTLFVTLLAALQVLVGRLSGEDDIVIAIPTAGQSRAGVPGLVGHCVNLLPLRSRLDREASFATHLKATRTHLLDAYDHQDTTYGALVRALGLPADPSRLPLTQIQFNLEKLGSGPDLPGLALSTTPNPKAFSNFDLFVNFIESADGIRVDCDYNTDLFEVTTIARWIGHLKTMLGAIATDSTATVATLPLLSATERRWMIETLNATAATDFDLRPVPALVADQASRTPHAPALAWRETALTFAELDARVNRLAQAIADRIPGVGGRILVATTRSSDLVVAMLAVLRAGHAYVPLDLQQPIARQRLIVANAAISGVICDTPEVSATFSELPLIDLHAEAEAIAALPSEAPFLAATPSLDAIAYVIFTSGSTGIPKGVAVTHRSLVNLLWSMARRPGFSSADTLLAVTTIGFDIAGAELLLPLITGGRVVIADRAEVTDGFALVERIDRSNATMVQATPSLWRMLVEAGFRPRPGLTMIAGGEPLPRDLAELLGAGGSPLWNAYGPTETTIWSSFSAVAAQGPISIGEPALNTDMHVLDGALQLAPVGVEGELFIGGAGLATGYFGRDDLTAAAFLTVTLPGQAPRRLYRTGDCARRLADGSLHLLGRRDGQVKLRGIRIEIEEIETVMRQAPGVAAAAVALRDTAGPNPRLVGYVVSDAPIEAADLMRHAESRLPAAMVPHVWLRIPALPVNPNGKLNRQALPDPSNDDVLPRREREAPRTPVQARLAEMLAELLHTPDIGIDDNLFGLGLDSMQLFRVAARLRADGLGLDARDVLTHPTIAALAEVAARADRRLDPEGVPSLRSFRRKAIV